MLLRYYTDIIGVSDGFVKDGKGSDGYILVKESAEERHIRGSLGVDGSPEDMSSYQAELFGVLAMLLIITILTKDAPDTDVKCWIYCDSESAVNRVKEIESEHVFPYSIKSANCDKYDVLSSIRELKKH